MTNTVNLPVPSPLDVANEAIADIVRDAINAGETPINLFGNIAERGLAALVVNLLDQMPTETTADEAVAIARQVTDTVVERAFARADKTVAAITTLS